MINNDVIIRAFKTFIQTFLSAISLSVMNITNLSTLRSAVIAAGAAGVSAVWNTIINAKK